MATREPTPDAFRRRPPVSPVSRVTAPATRRTGKVTICKGICGIGNRLLFLTEAFRRCERTGSRLFVLWNDYMFSGRADVNVFYEAFAVHPRFDAGYRQVADIPDHRTCPVDPPLWTGRLQDDIYALGERYRDLGRATVGRPSSPAGFAGRRLEVLFGAPPPYRAREDLGPLRERLVSNVWPTGRIIDDVDAFYGAWLAGVPSLGVHVRHASWEKRKRHRRDLHASVTKFLRAHPDGRIFLATDGASVIEELKKAFGDRVVTRRKWLPTGSRSRRASGPASLHERGRGEKLPGEAAAFDIFLDAVVELFLLARCGALRYQHDSSFSVVSALYSRSANVQPWGETTLGVGDAALMRVIRECLVSMRTRSAAGAPG